MKYYIIAGERSGDLHGSNLAKELKKQDKNAQIRCWGGDLMAGAGCDLVKHYRDSAFMGAWEAAINIGTILKNLKFCKKDLLSYKPDVLILIDYPGFNMKMAKYARQNGIRVVYYISPKIWAWNQGRIRQIRDYVDKMLLVLPFEKEFYEKNGCNAEYVGNPTLDAVKAHRVDPDFYDRNNLPEDKSLVALLPGSREQELRHILPVMIETARLFPDMHFAVAAVNNLNGSLYQPTLNVQNISLVREQTYDLLAYADAAVVASGTATLETALWDVPQVVTYKTSPITYWLARWVIKVKYISLVNLIAGKEVVRELIQEDMNASAIASELKEIMHNKDRRLFIIQEYNRIKEMLKDGKASYLAARKIVEFTTQRGQEKK